MKENITSPCIDHKSEDCKEQSKSKSEQSNNNGQSVKVETMKSSGVPFLRVYVGSPLHHVFLNICHLTHNYYSRLDNLVSFLHLSRTSLMLKFLMDKRKASNFKTTLLIIKSI